MEVIIEDRQKTFWIQVADERVFTVDEIWPGGDAPENPTVDDVIEQIKFTSSRNSFPLDWGFYINAYVDGKNVW